MNSSRWRSTKIIHFTLLANDPQNFSPNFSIQNTQSSAQMGQGRLSLLTALDKTQFYSLDSFRRNNHLLKMFKTCEKLFYQLLVHTGLY